MNCSEKIKIILGVFGAVGFLILLGSVGTMDMNTMQGIPDSPEVIRNAIIGAVLMFGSLIINEYI